MFSISNSTASHIEKQADSLISSLPPSSADLLDALRRAVRHGRPDLARRLAGRLTGHDREIALIELSDAVIGGAR